MKHIKQTVRRRSVYAAVDYTMSPQESARWDRGDETERRVILGTIGDRLATEKPEQGGRSFRFFHSDGRLVGKCTHHEPLFDDA
jgi:hypothetical protein